MQKSCRLVDVPRCLPPLVAWRSISQTFISVVWNKCVMWQIKGCHSGCVILGVPCGLCNGTGKKWKAQILGMELHADFFVVSNQSCFKKPICQDQSHESYSSSRRDVLRKEILPQEMWASRGYSLSFPIYINRVNRDCFHDVVPCHVFPCHHTEQTTMIHYVMLRSCS